MAALDIMSFLESAVVELSDAGQQNAQLQILQVSFLTHNFHQSHTIDTVATQSAEVTHL